VYGGMEFNTGEESTGRQGFGEGRELREPLVSEKSDASEKLVFVLIGRGLCFSCVMHFSFILFYFC